ncbi:MAG: hypothetical protein IJ776_06790 [Paludibacteraceae bacterium]|nr:hypothetical protein [Paludibacteraceae bacterium]
MKLKILLSLVLFSSAIYLSASDIIVTLESQKIEALITEVSSSEVRYKKASNPDGPTFVITTADIASIIYQNGDVQAFDSQPSQQSVVIVEQPAPAKTSKNKHNNYMVAGTGGYPLQQIGYSKFACGNIQMNRKQYADFLRNNSAFAYSMYRDGVILEYCGWSALGTGVVFIGVLTPFFWPGAIIGGIIALESAPLLYFGITRQRNSVTVYNMERSGVKPQLSFRLKPKDFNSDGLGFALSF